MTRHTILLVQPGAPPTRTYYDFPDVVGAYNMVISLYEQQLKVMNPHTKHITYDIQNLLGFVDSMQDISALVFDNRTTQYSPQGRDWIKKGVYDHLRKQANGR